jgi:hypothetical protein
MSGCEGCLQTAKAINEAMAKTQTEAKQYAVTNGKNVFIYFDETGQPQYMVEEAARACGIQPTGGIVSFLQ